MPTRIDPSPLGQGQDEEVEGILEFSKGGFQDTEMFGLIARRPELVKVIGPVFGELFGGNGKTGGEGGFPDAAFLRENGQNFHKDGLSLEVAIGL